MANLRFVALIATVALMVSGCGSEKVTVTTPAAKSSSSTSSGTPAAEAPQEPLDADACVEVSGANLDLATATSAADAKTAADTLTKYGPPASVQEAIDHFVGTVGMQFDDPDYQKFNDRIDEWAKQVCP